MERNFIDRRDAGQLLAAEMLDYRNREQTIVLALPRGGVPVAYPIASTLGLPLDVLIVRKVGLPGNPELAMGAIASGDVEVINRNVADAWQIDDAQFSEVARREMVELRRREDLYRRGREPLVLAGKTVILVDDGVATGATIKAAVSALRKMQVKSIVVAVPVASREASTELRTIADHFVCLKSPEAFYAVGQVYRDFPQMEDDEVCELLGVKCEM